MRKTWFLVGSILGLLLIASAVKSEVRSQDAENGFAPMFTELRVSVPFQFYAGDTPMTAGGYIIARQNIWEPQVLSLTKADGTKTIFMMVHLKEMGAPAKTSGVWFNKYGNQYFLAGIQIEDYNNGQELNRSHTEELAAEGELGTQVHLPTVLK